MFVALLLLMLLACSCQALQSFGTEISYYPKQTSTDGSITVVIRNKQNYDVCAFDGWICYNGFCGYQYSVAYVVYDSGEWCQAEGITTLKLPSNAPLQLQLENYWFANSTYFINGLTSWTTIALVEVRNRSDTGKANQSPQTTMLPVVRVPSNCQRDFTLLAFDPDGDEVKCRYGNVTLSECNPCTPPAVLNLSSPCTLSFSPTTAVGLYFVPLMVEDFPRETIILTQTDGEQTTVTTNTALSRLPVQFALQVDPVVPSCTEGLYLPMFLPPTPANGAQFYIPVSQTLEISITAQANISTISQLLYSGPHDIHVNILGTGQFTLSWTPSDYEDGESVPICFVAKAFYNSVEYQSELRCIVVSVVGGIESSPTAQPPTTAPAPTEASNKYVIAANVRISSTTPLSDDYIRTTLIQQLKDKLVSAGIPLDTVLTFLKEYQLNVSPTATPAGPV